MLYVDKLLRPLLTHVPITVQYNIPNTITKSNEYVNLFHNPYKGHVMKIKDLYF